VPRAGRLQLFNDFHGPHLGRAAERAGSEAGAQGIDRGQLGLEPALDGADNMHHVRAALDEHEPVHLYGAVLAYASHVVAAQVDQHYVLGALLFVAEHFLGERLVFLFRCAAGSRAGDGPVFHFALVDAHQQLRRGPCKFQYLERGSF
jgi:hypothetical protein